MYKFDIFLKGIISSRSYVKLNTKRLKISTYLCLLFSPTFYPLSAGKCANY